MLQSWKCPFITHSGFPGTTDLLSEVNGNVKVQSQSSSTWQNKYGGTAAGNSLLQKVLDRGGPCSLEVSNMIPQNEQLLDLLSMSQR